MSASGVERRRGRQRSARWELWPAWLAAVLLALPALGVGAFSDDFVRHLLLEERIPGFAHDWTELYDFTRGEAISGLIARGYVPWQAHPELSMRFFRPLSSLVVALDHAVFGRAEVPGVLLNIAWFLAMFWLVTALHKRLLPSGPRRLAALIYALASAHAMNLAWVSTRHLMIGAVFTFLAVYLHLLGRQGAPTQVRWWYRPASLVALVLGMLSSESFLGGTVFIGCYELFERTEAWRTRLAQVAPTLVLSTLYLLGYGLFGYGPRHSGLYISPFADLSAFLLAVLERWPVLLGELGGAFPSALWVTLREARPALVAFGVVVVALIAALSITAPFDEAERRRLRFLASAAALSCLPMVGGVINGRMLVIPMLGSSAVVAWCIHRQWRREQHGARRWLVKLGAGALAVLHLGLAPLVHLGMTKTMSDLAKGQRRLAETFDDRACKDGDVALLLTASDPSLSLSGGASLAYFRPELALRVHEMHVLSLAPHPLRVTREASTTLLLEVLDLPRRSNAFEHLFNDEPIEAGYRVTYGKLGAEVLSAAAGLPIRVRFRIPERSCLLMLKGGRLESTRPPAVGEQLSVRYEPGLFGL